MAKDKEKKEDKKRNNVILKLMGLTQSVSDKLYQQTRFTNAADMHDLEASMKDMDNTIDKLIAFNKNETGGISYTSSIMARAMASADPEESKKFRDEMNNLLDDKSIIDGDLNSLLNNVDIIDHDRRIDTICHYMTKLDQALSAKKDCVLSADHFDKEFLNIISESNAEKADVFSNRCKELKEMYDFNTKADEWYDTAARYGERFIYCIPYNKGVARLLKTKSKSELLTSATISYKGIVSEAMSFDNETFSLGDSVVQEMKNIDFDMDIEFNRSAILISAVEEQVRINRSMRTVNEMCIVNEDTIVVTEDIEDQLVRSPSRKMHHTFDHTIADDLSFDNFEYSKDGLITKNDSKEKKIPEITVPGSIIRELDRKNIKPLYINNTCLGYIYIECDDVAPNNIRNIQSFSDPNALMNTTNSYIIGSGSKKHVVSDKIVDFVARRLSSMIDGEFVNNNQDISQDIYAILMHNDKFLNSKNPRVRITYLPPNDVVHIKFRTDPYTHRGLSDLENAIVPATLYSALYITNAIWNLTRAQDKRVYYVKQTVDTNISQILLNTIEQIKKGNMGMRQIENIQHILSITGQFNDYVIPTSQSGEEPIRMEVLQGQKVDLQTELMEVLLENSVECTEVPLDYLAQRSSVEFATQLQMTNNKFLMIIYKRQEQYQKFLTQIFAKLYYNQYGEMDSIKVKLPPPMFLNITNINQIMMNSADMVQKIIELYGTNEPDEVKAKVSKYLNLMYMSSYLDIPEIERQFRIAKQEYNQEKQSDGGEDEGY